MRKRGVIRLVTALVLVLGIAGCGSKGESGEVPHFGSGRTDYDGFWYLERESLSLDNKNVTVYIPNKEHYVLEEAYVTSGKMGVFLEIDINPYGGEAEYATAEENLKAELESYYEENKDASYFLDAEMGEIQVNSDGSQAAGTISYISYDYYKESYSYMENTIVLYELDEDFFVRVWIMVGGEEVCEETEGLVAELEEFYQVNLPWSNENAQAKLDAYVPESDPASGWEYVPDVAGGEGKDLVFDIPEGWEVIPDYGIRAYMPQGELAGTGCVIQIDEEYIGDALNYIQYFDFDSEEYQNYARQNMGLSEEEEFYTSSVECSLGKTCRLERPGNGGMGMTAYMIYAEDGYIHYIVGGYSEDIPGAKEEVQEAMKNILDTAELV